MENGKLRKWAGKMLEGSTIGSDDVAIKTAKRVNIREKVVGGIRYEDSHDGTLAYVYLYDCDLNDCHISTKSYQNDNFGYVEFNLYGCGIEGCRISELAFDCVRNTLDASVCVSSYFRQVSVYDGVMSECVIESCVADRCFAVGCAGSGISSNGSTFIESKIGNMDIFGYNVTEF